MSTDFGFNAVDVPGYYFISYNTEDSDRIAEICNYLQKKGLPIWYDEGIPHDSYWESVLAEKIDNCKEAIFFITKGIFEKGRTRSLDEIYTYKEYCLTRIYEKKALIVLLDEINVKKDVPYSLMSWWQEINNRQGIVAIRESSEEIGRRIIQSLGIRLKDNPPIVNVEDNILKSVSGTNLSISDNKLMWGPERKTFTMSSPSSFPTFNSIIDNPTIGDERRFVRIGEIKSERTQLSKSAIISPGKQYLIYIYFHNNAGTEYNNIEHDRLGIALKTRVSTNYTKIITAKQPGYVMAKITADNSMPDSVWAKVCLNTNDSIVKLKYVKGSAKIYCDWKANRSGISENLFTEEGTLIGLNELNGVIPGCEEYHGAISYILQAE